jgi:NAD(P)H-nitrite reductase large subunit
MDKKCPYLIIGNSVAAMGAIDGIREHDARSLITVVAKEPEHTYSRPLISYLLSGKVDESRMFFRPTDFYEKNNIKALLGVEATSIDTEKRIVKTSDGGSLGFGKLLIATGGRPILPEDIKGMPKGPAREKQGVFTFTTWNDARKIKDYIERNSVKKAVVVGGGLIGLKSTEALMGLSIKITVVELMDCILSATFDKTASDLATKLLEKAGVKVLCGTTIEKINKQGPRIKSVTMKDGTKEHCDMLVFAIGVLPEKSIAEGTEIEIDRGILVDQNMRTPVRGIYAAGDVAQALDLLSGMKRTIPIFPNAYRQGYIAGCNMAGKKRAYEGGMAMNSIDICGVPTISVGITAPDDKDYEVISALDVSASTYKKLVLRDDKIIGAIFIREIDRAGIITGLIRNKISVSEFKDLLLTEEFGLISLPEQYRKYVISGREITV